MHLARVATSAVALVNLITFPTVIITANVFLAFFTDCKTSPRDTAYDVTRGRRRTGAYRSSTDKNAHYITALIEIQGSTNELS